MQVLFSKILGTFCPQRKSSVPGPFAKAQCLDHSQKRLLRSRRRLRGSSFTSWIGRSAHTVWNTLLCTQASTQCVLHGMAELLHQIKYTDLIGLGQVS